MCKLFCNSKKHFKFYLTPLNIKFLKLNSVKLPSRNVLSLGAVCLSLIVGVSIYNYTKSQSFRESSIIAATGGEESVQDQALIQQAIAQSQVDSFTSTSTNPFDPSPNDNLTDSLSKRLFAGYLSYDQNGQLDTQSGVDELSNKIVSSIQPKDIPSPDYSLNDAKVFTPKSSDEVRAYGNAIALAILNNFVVVNNNPALYNSDLLAYVPVYKKTASDLMKISVPSTLLEDHVSLANTYVISAKAFPDINDQHKDPLKALVSLKSLKDSTDQQNVLFTDIENYFNTNGIIFNNDEPGKIWNKKVQ